MEQRGTAIQLNTQGPNGGSLVLVVDFELKTASLLEVTKKWQYHGLECSGL